MNLIIFFMNVILINGVNNVRNVCGFSFVRLDVARLGYFNSFMNGEVIIEGPKVGDIYLMERSDQIKKVDKAMKKKAKLEQKYKSTKKISVFDFTPVRAGIKVVRLAKSKSDLSRMDKEIDRLDAERGVNKFCSGDAPLEDVCEQAFTNSFFGKKNWKYDDYSSKPKCVEKQINLQKDKKSFVDERLFVGCKIKNENLYAFLEASTRYVQGKNLKFFVFTEDNRYMNPVAFLMNKKPPKVINIPIKGEDEEAAPLLKS